MAKLVSPQLTDDLLEWRRLSLAAQHVASVPLGKPANFLVKPDGEAVIRGDTVFVRALSSTTRDMHVGGSRIILKMTQTDWLLVKHSTLPLKVLQASTVKPDERGDVILDTTGPQCVIISQVETSRHETLTFAEIFAGGFQGWSQAAWSLQRIGVPVSVAWGVEKAADCVPMQRAIHPEQEEVTSITELSRIQSLDSFLMVVGDVCDNWWLRTQNIKPINALAVSAPCQPWSFAGRETGLSSPVGRLMLRMADIASALEVDFVVIEQVAGFRAHPDYGFVITAWQEAGFDISWRATLDLLEVLPCQRSRHLLVLQKAGALPDALPATCHWKCPHPGNLCSTGSLFDLPPAMRNSCTPSSETLNLYLNPAMIPHLRNSHNQSDAKAFRVKKGHQTTSCFLAQYGFAHLLLPDLLVSKGLFGSLVEVDGLVRFFAPPEIASLHGAVRPILCQSNRRLCMRLLGNAISVPHAAVALLQCSHAAGIALQIHTQQALQACLQDRLHNANTVLIPDGLDWLLCPCHEAHRLCRLVAEPRVPLPCITDLFRSVTLQTLDSTCVLMVSHQVDLAHFFRELRIPPDSQTTPSALQPGSTAVSVTLPFLPALPSARHQDEDADWQRSCVVCTQSGVFVVQTVSPLLPLLFATIAAACESITGSPQLLCRTSGVEIHSLQNLPWLTVLVPKSAEPDISTITWLSKVGRGCKLHVSTAKVQAEIPPSQSAEAWLGMPLGLTLALGWPTSFVPDPPGDGDSLQITWRPCHTRLCINEDLLTKVLLHSFLASRAQAVADRPGQGPVVEVSIQVVAEPVWRGSLPRHFLNDLLLDWWYELIGPREVRRGCRLLSGPFPLPAGTTCHSILNRSHGRGHVRRDGTLLLNLHPSIHGGGAKDETKQWSMARLATLCLSQGADLSSVSPFVEAVVQAAGVGKLTTFLKLQGDQQQWEAVSQFATSRDISVPVLTNKHAKAEARSRRQAQRSKQQQRQLCANDITLEPGFFVNADGTDCAVLESMCPGSSGVYVTDQDQAPDLLKALTGVQPDELGILILGHGCKPGTVGCQPLSFPATCGSPPNKILVAGCLHNMGGKKITCKHAAEADVVVTENCCCQFSVHQDEFEPETWQHITASPVRAISDIFMQGGHCRPFHAPWARVFLCRGRPSTPQLADVVSFHARIDHTELDQTLRLSGHNHVYALPKTWSKQPHPDFSILWLGPIRAEALRAALQVPEQRGITRNRDKYGLRVCSTAYGKAFSQLHPGQEVPKKLQISLMFRAGPFPAEVGPSDIEAWSSKCGWTVRVVKALGAEHWLLGAQGPPATDCLAFNGRTILIVPVQGRSQTPSFIQSGSLPRHPPAASSQGSAEEDPWLLNDPWKNYRKTPQVGGHSAKHTAAQPQVPRAITGPTEARFQDQDARISAMEQGLAELRSVSEQRHKEAQLAREEDAKKHTASITELRGQIGSLSSDFAQQLRTSVEALQGAQSQQLQQVMSSFEEVKNLLSVRDRDPSKRSRLDDGNGA